MSTVIGLDIGTSGIRAAEVTAGRRGPQLRRVASVPLPEGTVRAGRVLEPEALAAALVELWSRGKFTSRDVCIGLADDSVLVRQTDVDWMPEEDLRKALRYQIADLVPVPVDQANLDHVLLEELEEEDGDDARRIARILLVAAPQELVDGLVRAVQSAGLRVVRADLAPLALVRATGAATRVGHQHDGVPFGSPGPSGIEAVVDVGAETVTVILHRDGRPTFVRFLPGVGGARLTRHLQEKFDWEVAEAERTKIVAGLLPATRDPEQPATVEHPAQHALTDLALELVEEVRATLEFSMEAHDQTAARIDRLVLTGGGARLGGLAHLAETVLGMPVEHVTHPAGLQGRRSARTAAQVDDSLVLATGLAMGGAA